MPASCGLQEVLMDADDHISSSSPQVLTHDVQAYLCPMPDMWVPCIHDKTKAVFHAAKIDIN